MTDILLKDGGRAHASEYGGREEELMAREQICSYSVVFPSEDMQTLADTRFMGEEPFAELADVKTERELAAFLRSYDNRFMLCELKGRAAIVVPSMYPSSSLALVLIFDDERYTLSEILRILESSPIADILVLSKQISAPPARMTDALRKKNERVCELCFELRACFIDALSSENGGGEPVGLESLRRGTLGLSRLIGVPVSFGESEDAQDGSGFDRTDLPLFYSFLLTFLLSARSRAPKRRADVTVGQQSRAAMLTVCFDSDGPMSLSNEILVWERLASDRNMYFEYYCEGSRLSVSFHPLRRDWSYLGLKQDFEY